ncbi:unnamed protein product [Ilex paraguariensis]|uniref:Uncharacterized protein n=1 Tax=Ilex paraguariensis TaxID=185542 RepID=A0ABC8T756_9AQUA
MSPTNRTGLLGLFGNKVVSIEYYTEKINELTPKLEAEQKVTLRKKQQGSALVFFTGRVTVASAAAVIKTLLEAYLPQIALNVFLALLLKFLLFLSKAEGIPSESHAIRAASGKYLYFRVSNDELTDILDFMELRFFVGYGLELSRIVPLIIFHIKRKYLCKTEAELKEAWAPGNLEFGTRIPGDMLVVTIVFCYSVIVPIIIPFGFVYFGLGWLTLRNQVMPIVPNEIIILARTFVLAYNDMITHGSCFRSKLLNLWKDVASHSHARLSFLTPILSHHVRLLWREEILLRSISDSPSDTVLDLRLCRKKFYRFFQAIALEVAYRELKEIPNMELVFRSFIPPSLSAEKSDDDQFEEALSQVSRTGSFV